MKLPALLRSALVILSFGLSTVQALTLTEVLQHTDNRVSVINAVSELHNAQANWQRVRRDPLAVRSDTLQAEQRLELAKVSLEQARYAAQSDLTRAYTGVLQARAQVKLAEQALALSQHALEIATIRFESGSLTRLELGDAQAALNEAENNLRAATKGHDLALASLSSMLGETAAALAGVPAKFFVAPPPLKTVLENARRHPDLLSVEQQAALAQLGAEVLHPLYAAQSQIDAARSQLASAQSIVRETQRGFGLQVRNLHSQALNARQTLRLRSRSLAAARAQLGTQRQRLQGGLISQLELEQARLQTRQTALEAQNARIDYLHALLGLQAGSLTPLGGPFASTTSLGSRQ